MDDLYWLQLVNYNFIQDVISFFRNFFDQDKLQEHIKKYQEKTDNETWKWFFFQDWLIIEWHSPIFNYATQIFILWTCSFSCCAIHIVPTRLQFCA